MHLAGPDYPAPAKLNLFLHVVGRRADGYHLLQSVFTLIDCCDKVRLRVREDRVVRRVNEIPGVPSDEDLVVRAAIALREAAGLTGGVDIELDKRIPMGAGLGGGSSDAATTLMALNALWGTNFSRERLMEIGARLGADVPFFLFGRSAWVEGIGERLAPVEIPRQWYVVLTPAVGVPTGAVFAAAELTRDTEPLKMEDFSAQPQSFDGLAFRNTLEPVVAARFPAVREHLEWLRGHGNARMTGSGSCVFAAYGSRESAQRVLDELPESMSGFIAQGLDRHPLLG